MGYAEKRGDYWRGRYKKSDGKYGIVKDEFGDTVRFRSKRDAKQAADDREAAERANVRKPTVSGDITFIDYVNQWYERQDLALSTMQNYRNHLEEHLLPFFGEMSVSAISFVDVGAWEKAERAAGYAESSIKTWRSTLHLVLSDAVEEGLRETNPAARRRGRGKRLGRADRRGPEKAVTTALGTLLVAERAALLSGRDDEFVALVTMGFTGVRWGELVGLESEFIRPGSLRVEWQLYELDSGVLHRCPPKDGSRRSIDLPDWNSRMLADHLARVRPKACACHGLRYAFSGHRPPNHAARSGAKLVDVARLAGVSTGTVSNVLNRPDMVAQETRLRVESAVASLAFVPGGGSGDLAAHWRRSGFATWLFQPAATGWYPSRSGQPPRPVPVVGEPWPGVPARGRGAAARADSCWLPVARRLTPHGLRHSHKTIMDELGTPPKLKDERMGHEDGSVGSRYSHVTDSMRQRLLEDLTAVWLEALEARRECNPRSPVAVLDRLLAAAGAGR